jgi:hypothetical protein
VGLKLFKKDFIGIEGCLGPDSQIIQAHGSIVRLSGVTYIPLCETWGDPTYLEMVDRIKQLSVHIRACSSVSGLGVHDGLSAKVNQGEEGERQERDMLAFGRFFFLPVSLSGGVAGCEEDADA